MGWMLSHSGDYNNELVHRHRNPGLLVAGLTVLLVALHYGRMRGLYGGMAAGSRLTQRIDLPLEEKEHMPPKGKAQLTDDDVTLLRRECPRELGPDGGDRCRAGSTGALTELNYLNLYGTGVSDSGLAALRPLASLRSLYLWQIRVTPAAASALADRLTDRRKVQRWRDQVAELESRIHEETFYYNLGAPKLELPAAPAPPSKMTKMPKPPPPAVPTPP